MLINITGIDGCGKGTQIVLLKNFLSKKYKVEVVKAYDELEKELFSSYIEYASQIEIMFLFQAFHTKQRIAAQKALGSGKIVIADRWDETYFGYHSQYGFLSQDREKREWLNQIAYAGLKPDLSFLIDIDVSKAMQRCIDRGADFFDKKSVEHHTSLRKKYLEIAKMGDSKWIVLDGNKNILAIHKEIVNKIRKFIKQEGQ